jgi:TetR/AcrR family transcriptional regulator, regulator of mycofactocin system
MDGPSRKRDATRQRLLEAATRRFLANGFEGTTAAAIADDAGVTERTFFRYFPTKADILVANWQDHAAFAMRVALTESRKTNLCDAVRDALILFTDRLEAEYGSRIRNAPHVFGDRSAFQATIMMLLDIENRVADEVARRTGRTPNDFEVRAAAHASVGVLRAALRSYIVVSTSRPMSELITDGMRRLRPTFNALSQ